jgi:hypothetical protein
MFINLQGETSGPTDAHNLAIVCLFYESYEKKIS